MSDKYTLVTVAYPGDIGFMIMQARSAARYVSPDLIHEIIVIENAPPEFPPGWRDKLMAAYGPLADIVRIIPGSDIARLPRTVAGWFSQQVLKLEVATVVTTKTYMILDAKNHFVFPLTRDFVERNGKPRLFVHGYQKHPLRRYLEPILRYFGLPLTHVDRMLPTTPPFYADTALVREMMQTMAAREKKKFPDLFVSSPIRFTEFFTIAAYLLSKGRRFEDYYDISGGHTQIIWKETAHDDAVVAQAISRTKQGKTPLFSVHRGSLPLMTTRSKEAVAEFWTQQGLFPTKLAALHYMSDPNKVD